LIVRVQCGVSCFAQQLSAKTKRYETNNYQTSFPRTYLLNLSKGKNSGRGGGAALTIANKVNCYCRNARRQRPAKHMKFRFSFTSLSRAPTCPAPFFHAPGHGDSRKKDIMGEGRDTTKISVINFGTKRATKVQLPWEENQSFY